MGALPNERIGRHGLKLIRRMQYNLVETRVSASEGYHKTRRAVEMMNAMLSYIHSAPTKTKWITNASGKRDAIMVPKVIAAECPTFGAQFT